MNVILSTLQLPGGLVSLTMRLNCSQRIIHVFGVSGALTSFALDTTQSFSLWRSTCVVEEAHRNRVVPPRTLNVSCVTMSRSLVRLLGGKDGSRGRHIQRDVDGTTVFAVPKNSPLMTTKSTASMEF